MGENRTGNANVYSTLNTNEIDNESILRFTFVVYIVQLAYSSIISLLVRYILYEIIRVK